MTILHIDKTVADNTIWFDNPIQKSMNLSLISCSFVNTMMNLSSEGTISNTESVLLRVPRGNYKTVAQVKSVIDKGISIGEKPVKIEGKYITANVSVRLNDALANLLGVETSLEVKSRTEIKLAKTPNAVYIHCDIIDSTQVINNKKYSKVLAYINTKNLNDTINHNPERLYIPASHEYINSIRFWVTDTSNQLIKDGLYPMHIVLELIKKKKI